jgi:hypothetical protein
MTPSVPVLTFVSRRGEFAYECQNQRNTCKYWMLVPLFHLKFLVNFATISGGTSNGRR